MSNFKPSGSGRCEHCPDGAGCWAHRDIPVLCEPGVICRRTDEIHALKARAEAAEAERDALGINVGELETEKAVLRAEVERQASALRDVCAERDKVTQNWERACTEVERLAEGARGEDAMRFRKKPVVIEAIQWTGSNLTDVISFTGWHDSAASRWTWEEYTRVVDQGGLKIFTLEGPLMASIGDWIIRGVKGEFYPCKPDVFLATYEPANESAVGWKACAEVERLKADQQDWRKGVAYIRAAAGMGEGNLYPGDIARRVLEIRAEIERLTREKAEALAHSTQAQTEQTYIEMRELWRLEKAAHVKASRLLERALDKLRHHDGCGMRGAAIRLVCTCGVTQIENAIRTFLKVDK